MYIYLYIHTRTFKNSLKIHVMKLFQHLSLSSFSPTWNCGWCICSPLLISTDQQQHTPLAPRSSVYSSRHLLKKAGRGLLLAKGCLVRSGRTRTSTRWQSLGRLFNFTWEFLYFHHRVHYPRYLICYNVVWSDNFKNCKQKKKNL